MSIRPATIRPATATLEHMALASAGAVPALAENSEQPLHARHQIRLRRFEQEVEMLAHEHPGMYPPAATPASLFPPLQKNQAVIVGFKHHLPAIATGHDMIHRSRSLASQRPRHASFSSISAPASILIWRNARTYPRQMVSVSTTIGWRVVRFVSIEAYIRKCRDQ